MVVERKWRLGWDTAGIPVGVLYHPPVVDVLEGVAGYLLLVGAATAILIAEGEPGVFVECGTSTTHMVASRCAHRSQVWVWVWRGCNW